MTKKVFSRRDILKAASVAATISLTPTFLPAQVLGRDGKISPSNKITLGIIGTGGRGWHDLKRFLVQPDVQFLAVCDVQRERRERCKNLAEKNYNIKNCDLYRDFRELLE